MQTRVWTKFIELSPDGEPPLPHKSQLHALLYVFVSQHKPFIFRMYLKNFKRAPTLEELLVYWIRVQKPYKLALELIVSDPRSVLLGFSKYDHDWLRMLLTKVPANSARSLPDEYEAVVRAFKKWLASKQRYLVEPDDVIRAIWEWLCYDPDGKFWCNYLNMSSFLSWRLVEKLIQRLPEGNLRDKLQELLDAEKR